MHTLDSVYPEYTLEAVEVNYSFEAIGFCAHARSYMHTYITCNQYSHEVRLFTYQGETNIVD